MLFLYVGKTHSMFGSDWESIFMRTSQRKLKQRTYIDEMSSDNQHVGIIPRAILKIFEELKHPDNVKKQFTVYCSFLQIYNEKIYDLLQVTTSFKRKLVLNFNILRIKTSLKP